jgi:ABC-type multidrug transport system fused ATPase/permease subunit
MIQFVEPSQQPAISNGVVIALTIFGLQLIYVLAINTADSINRRVMQITAGMLTSAIYRKSLRLSARSRSQFPAGHIMNLINVDVKQITVFFVSLAGILVIPIQLIISVYFLWNLVGISFLFGLLVVLGVGMITIILGPVVGKLVQGWTEHGDVRIGTMREFVQGIRTVKYRTLESYFHSKLMESRTEQIRYLKKVFMVLGGMQGLMMCVSPILIAGTVGFYAQRNDGIVTSTIIFPTVIYINSLSIPLQGLGGVLVAVAQGFTSMTRLGEFLQAAELQVHEEGKIRGNNTANTIHLERNAKKSNSAVYLHNVHWQLLPPKPVEDPKKVSQQGKQEKGEKREKKSKKELSAVPEHDIDDSTLKPFMIKEVSLSIPKGSLVAIIGPVGSGKTTFVEGILGELDRTNGGCFVEGTIAYAPQEPWIFQGSIKDNILFGSPFYQSRLEECIAASGLGMDIEGMPDGVESLIGEQGTTLSGGQKSRLSLARAIYANTDIVILDCPLASLDATVASQVFSNAICKYLKTKTVIMITHQLDILDKFDAIIVLDHGMVVEYGPVEKLREGGRFAALIKEHQSTNEAEVTTTVTLREVDQPADIIEKEELMTGQLDSRTYQTLLKAIGTPLCILYAIAMLVLIASSISSPFFLSIWSSQMVSNPRNLEIYLALNGSIVLSTITFFFTVLFMGLSGAIYFHDIALKSVLHATISFFDSNPVGRILNRFSTDIQALDFGIATVLGNLSLAFVFLLVIIVLVCQASWYLLGIFY